MSLSQDDIIKNGRIYFKTAEKYNSITNSLIEFLGTNFIKAPLYPLQSQPNSFEGGLIDHILRVTKYIIALNDIIEPIEKRSTRESLVKVSLLHQIGKSHLYKENDNEWEQTKGKFYIYNKLITMSIGERSAYYALKHGVELNEEEYGAIVSFDKPEDDAQIKRYNTILGDILKMANIMALKEEDTIYGIK